MSNEMVFMMGLPAAGKTTVADAMFPSYTHIDADKFKERIDGYDPENAFLVHEESMQMYEAAFLRAVAGRTGMFVVDGTGVNAESMVRRIRQAQFAGFVTRLVYVTCSLETSLERANGRERKVPESVIREKALNIATSFEIVSQYVDLVQVVDNN